jgi:murein DD-endopeptidase MepM/ murein hydrolase activator NlpD
MKKRLSILVILLICLSIFQTQLAASQQPYDHVFENIPPQIMEWISPVPTYALVTSKWNQPRSSGTNPHRGVDISATVGTRVNAVASGWLTKQISSNANGIDVGFKIDVSPTFYINYYHLETVKPLDRYYTRGEQIGTSYHQNSPNQILIRTA